jgi:carbamoyltransferase
MITWGISANSHDAALAVFKHQPWHNDGIELLFASHSERYSGIKNDPHLNRKLIEEAKQYGDPDEIIWYERPYIKSLRQIRAGQGFKFKENNIRNYLNSHGVLAPVFTVDHHHAHAAAGYYTSPFTEATVVCIDSIGEFDTLSIWSAQGKKLQRIHSQGYPHSVGLWYSAMTQRIGLKPQEDEYILMGMAAYGDPHRLFYDILNDFFYPMENNIFQKVFYPVPKIKLRQNLHRGCLWWRQDLNTLQDYFDIAAATQAVYEYILKLVSNWARWKSDSGNLVLMGGCALNCSANSKIYKDWNRVWIMPNPGDAGSAIGSVLAYYRRRMHWTGPYLGHNILGEYPVDRIIEELKTTGICGVANGRAEFGPRALGHRSLLADPRGAEIKDRVNAIKKRQQFRPFAPAILEEHAAEHFEGPVGPYMQYTALCKHPELYPAIIHADGTSRVQTVGPNDSTGFRKLLERWYAETGCPMLLNTSLNIKGRPIVNTVEDAEEFEKHYNVKVFTDA